MIIGQSRRIFMNQFRAMQMNMDMMNSIYMCCVSVCFEN